MKIEQTEVSISAPDGQMPAFLLTPTEPNHKPAVLLLMEAFGLTSHIRDVAIRIAREGYVVLVPDLYYRELPNNKFGYDEVESAMAMMYRLDLKSVEADIRAALAFLKSQKDVYRDKPGEAALPCDKLGTASAKSERGLGVKIVPIAIQYSQPYPTWGTDVTIHIGCPIEVADYTGNSVKQEAKRLTSDLTKALQKLNHQEAELTQHAFAEIANG